MNHLAQCLCRCYISSPSFAVGLVTSPLQAGEATPGATPEPSEVEDLLRAHVVSNDMLHSAMLVVIGCLSVHRHELTCKS